MLEYIGAAKASLDTAIAVTKAVKNIQQSVDEAEYKAQMAELLLALADTQTNLATLQMQMIEKDQRIKSLQEELKFKKTLKYRAPCFWATSEDGVEEPYCQKCYEKDGKAIRLQVHSIHHSGAWDCKVCGSHYRTPEYDSCFNSQSYETDYRNGF